jgi:hypothetical protein
VGQKLGSWNQVILDSEQRGSGCVSLCFAYICVTLCVVK